MKSEIPHLNLLALFVVTVLLPGCTTPEANENASVPQANRFYPPAPNSPRVQYLTSFSSNTDLGEQSGGFASFIVGEEAAEVDLIKPYGIDLHDGKAYICDTIAFAVDIVDFKQKTISRFAPRGAGRFGKPINISVDNDGTRYVADTAIGSVLIYDRDGGYRGAIGTRGTNKPSDVVVKGDRLYIADLNLSSVGIFDKFSREELLRIPREDDVPESKLLAPVNIAVGDDGMLYVSDFSGFHVKVYSREGKYIRTVGSLGSQVGGMIRPKGIDVDREGRFYLVDAAAEVVQVFNRDGELLMYFGEPLDSETGLVLPAKVRIDYDHVDLFKDYIAPGFQVDYMIFVTNQYGPRKVSVFGFGSRVN